MRLFLLSGLFITFSAFALDLPKAVIQGERVEPEEAVADSVVSLHLGDGGGCTGAALSDQVVITAAHCPDLGGGVAYVHHRAGDGAECSAALVKEVAYIPGAKKGEEEGASYLPDLALLRLETPLCGVIPAKLREGGVFEGEILYAAGYGQGTISLDRPDRVALKTISPEILPELYKAEIEHASDFKGVVEYYMNYISQFYLFALPVVSQSSLCHGDSGGPVYQEIKGSAHLIGVNGAIAAHHLGTPECKYGYLQMITPIEPHAEWIKTKMAEWSKAGPKSAR